MQSLHVHLFTDKRGRTVATVSVDTYHGGYRHHHLLCGDEIMPEGGSLDPWSQLAALWVRLREEKAKRTPAPAE